MDTVAELAPKVNLLLRQKKTSEANDLVDSALLDCDIGLTPTNLEQLRAARSWLYLRRRQHRKNAKEVLSR